MAKEHEDLVKQLDAFVKALKDQREHARPSDVYVNAIEISLAETFLKEANSHRRADSVIESIRLDSPLKRTSLIVAMEVVKSALVPDDSAVYTSAV